MPKGDAVEMDGTVIDTMRNSQFTVRLDNGHELLAYTGGKMRRFRIRILLGDRVRVEMSPYDLTRGRVSYRYRKPTSSSRQSVRNPNDRRNLAKLAAQLVEGCAAVIALVQIAITARSQDALRRV